MPQLFEQFPVLHTERLDLIEITQDHLTDLFELFTDKRVTEFFGMIALNEPSDAQKIFDMLNTRYNEGIGIRWGIALKGQKIIGNLGFNNFTPGHRSVIVFAIMPEYWNKGLMTEAIKEIVRFGFAELGVNRIEAEVIPGNLASEKALQKVGFMHEGLLRQWMFWEGKRNDINMYAILKSDNE
jgi:ribosomal-protein-alanine N-acetyltransferase